jgi:RNA polymerase sigma-70 factor (ECF subfamily)
VRRDLERRLLGGTLIVLSSQDTGWQSEHELGRFPRVTGVAAGDRQAVDARLVGRMAGGDKSALAELYDRHAPTMLAVGIRMLGDAREAEDLLHDVFLEAWQAAAQYDPARGSVSTWLLLRMRSRTLDRIRSAGRSRTVVTDDPLGAAPSAEQGSAQDLPADRLAIRRALDELPPEQRRVLELAYFGGLSSSEIATAVGISIGTVKSRTAAALSKLRARLATDRGLS